MENPQVTIIRLLQSNPEKVFALVVNDVPIISEGRLVYIMYQNQRLEAFTRKRNINTGRTDNEPFEHERLWKNLRDNTKYLGIDFASEYGDGKMCKVVINDKFRYLFIESPYLTVIKSIVRHIGRTINGRSSTVYNITLPKVDPALVNEIRNHWFDIHSYFQVESVIKYISICNKLVGRALARRLYPPSNRIFKNQIEYAGNVNFLHLFVEIAGIYNPFLEDMTFINPVINTQIFWKDSANKHLFLKAGKGYQVYCITPTSFCRCLGLDTKLAFDNNTALLMLAGLIYSGNFKSAEIPSASVSGFLKIERNPSNALEPVGVQFVFEDPRSKGTLQNVSVSNMTTLEYFAFGYRERLIKDSNIAFDRLVSVLRSATLLDRSEMR